MFIIDEIQTNDASCVVLTTTYAEFKDAESAFYTKCAHACVSAVPVHTVKMFNESGADIPGMVKVFTH